MAVHRSLRLVCLVLCLALPASFAAAPPPAAPALPSGVNFIGRNGAACAFDNFTSAQAAASNGDTLYVAAGAYISLIGTLTKTLTILSANAACTSASGVVTLNGNNAGRMVTIEGARP